MQAKSQNSILVVLVVLALFIPAGLQSQSPDAGMLSGYAEFRKGNLDKALSNFSNAISRNNADERLFISRGRVLMQMKDYENAIADFNEANEIIPGIANLWLAKAYALSGDQKKAISLLKDHLSSDYRVAEDSIKKDPSFSSLHTSPEWLDIWQNEWYNDEDKAAAEIKYYLKKGADEQALTYLDEQIAKSPLSSGMLALRGKVNLERGNYPAAISDYTSSLNLAKKGQNEGAVSGNPESSLYYNRALAYMGAEKFKEALSDMNKALREFPEFFNGYLVRSKAYAGLKSYDMAVKDVLFYLNYFGDDQQAVYTCGNYYYLAGDYMNALKYFNINLKEDPVNGMYFKARGKTYLKTGTYKYAINDLSMALDMIPDDAETWMYLGIAKMQSGDRENACSDFDKAKQLGSTEVVRYIVENCK